MGVSLSRVVQVIMPREPMELDVLILELSAFLIRKLKNKVIRVERISGWDGSNVRIVIRDLDSLEDVMEAVEEFERERGILGTIAPEVLTVEEYMFRSKDEELQEIDDVTLRDLKDYLLEKLGDEVLCVERISGWDGSNVRIVIRDLDSLEDVMEAVEEFERERGILGTIAPEVVLIDET